jgi:hypothetical protein
MECHKVCALFPEMNSEQFSALVKDIAQNGQREPIWTHEDQIIDGRHRYRACCGLGIVPKFQEWNGQGSLVAFVVSLNLHRRHLDTSQRAAVAAEVKPMLEEEGRRRLKQQAASKSRDDSGHFEPPCANLHKVDDDTPWDSTQEAAKMMGVSRRTVADAASVKEQDPAAFDAIKRGETTVHAAKKRLDPPKVKQPKPGANWLDMHIQVSDDPATYYDDIAAGLETYCPRGEPYDRLIAAMQRRVSRFAAAS